MVPRLSWRILTASLIYRVVLSDSQAMTVASSQLITRYSVLTWSVIADSFPVVYLLYAQVIMCRCQMAAGATHAANHWAWLVRSEHGTTRYRWRCGSRLRRWLLATRWCSSRHRSHRWPPSCWPRCISRPAFRQVSSMSYRCVVVLGVATNLENLEYSGISLSMENSWNSLRILCNLRENWLCALGAAHVKQSICSQVYLVHENCCCVQYGTTRCC